MATYIREETIILEAEQSAFDAVVPPRPSGPPAAAILSAGIGSLVLGLLTSGAEMSAALKTFLTFNAAVGPLAGKTVLAVAAYLVSWGILAIYFGRRDVPMRPIFTWTFVMVAFGVLFTFPLFYQYVV